MSTVNQNRERISDNSIIIGGLRVDCVTAAEVVNIVRQIVVERTPRLMAVTNASKTVLVQRDPELREILNQAFLVTADGMSVVWASKFLGTPLPERVTGIDTMIELVAKSAEYGWSVYFLGAKEHVVTRMVEVLKRQYPELKVAGFHDGYFDPGSAEMAHEIRKTAPDLLFVAMGSPTQEKWIARYQSVLGVPFALGVGGSFDHIAGFSLRAPLWLRRLGLEWFYRLASEPRRLWKRYLIGNTRFALLVLGQRLQMMFNRSGGANIQRHMK